MPDAGKKILIAEDEKAMAGVLMHKLALAGLKTVHVETGDLVVPQLEKEHFDLLLLDIMMPNMDGFDTLKMMQDKKITTPVIVLSNLNQNEDVLKAKSFGVVDFLIKSQVTPAQISERVKNFLQV